jgi:hypothetical protein
VKIYGSSLYLANARTLSPSLPRDSFAASTSALAKSSKSFSSPSIRIYEHLPSILSGAPFMITTRLSYFDAGFFWFLFRSLMNILNLISEEKGIRLSTTLPSFS